MPDSNKPRCNFLDSHGHQCSEIDMSNGFCFWHDPAFDKTGMDLTDKLERYAKKGGVLQGLHLKRANLRGLNLVNRGSKCGYDLSGSDFYRADLQGAHLFNINLQYGSLMKAHLGEANLHCANLTHTNLLGTKLYNARIDNIDIGEKLMQEYNALDAKQQKDRTKEVDNLEQAEEIYRSLRKAAEDQGLFELAGDFLYKELTMRRLQMPRNSLRRTTSKLVDYLCGYGEKPINTVIFSMSLIFICCLLYFLFGVSHGVEVVQLNFSNSFLENLRHLGLTLYYSVVTFTTLGYGDITPFGITRLIAALEAFIGSFTIALFVVVFVKRMTR